MSSCRCRHLLWTNAFMWTFNSSSFELCSLSFLSPSYCNLSTVCIYNCKRHKEPGPRVLCALPASLRLMSACAHVFGSGRICWVGGKRKLRILRGVLDMDASGSGALRRMVSERQELFFSSCDLPVSVNVLKKPWRRMLKCRVDVIQGVSRS